MSSISIHLYVAGSKKNMTVGWRNTVYHENERKVACEMRNNKRDWVMGREKWALQALPVIINKIKNNDKHFQLKYGSFTL